MALKIAGVGILILALFTGILFAYFRKDLDQIRPGEIDKRVQSTVTKYYDRNGELLWEDKGDGNYKLVVESDELSDNLKKQPLRLKTVTSLPILASVYRVQFGQQSTTLLVVIFRVDQRSLSSSLSKYSSRMKQPIVALAVFLGKSKNLFSLLKLSECTIRTKS